MAWLSRPGSSPTGRADVDVLVEELLDEHAEGVGLGQRGDLVAELEVFRMSCTLGEKPSR
jgi:hypothetical protein